MILKAKYGLLCLIQLVFVACVSSKDFVLYEKNKILPVIYISNAQLKPWSDDFNTLFQQLTGVRLQVIIAKPDNSVRNYIYIETTDEDGFKINSNENEIKITAKNIEAVKKANRLIFSNFTSLYKQILNDKNIFPQNKIIIPSSLAIQSNYPLEYKEPYFAQNFSKDFRLWNNTETIEESWALWGHNIGKFIKVTPPMYALTDGIPNDEQLNFASEELFEALAAQIAEKLSENLQINKFMIMPFDNDEVCMCNACKKLGNTQKNASPAVFALINRLAEKFPQASFFSTAYMTTITPPAQNLQKNVGVMISTMDFPKGVVLENHKQVSGIKEMINQWKVKTPTIYLWDYAINFDNYFEFFPTVSIAQKNLKFYLSNGVKGIFMHGSDEGGFVVFGDLKCYLYAKMFNNPEVDLKEQTEFYLENKYPAFGRKLATIYNEMEAKALENTKSIDIYGGIQQYENKYLNETYLNNLFNILSSVPTNNDKDLILLKTAVIFQKLELMRTKGISVNGYAQEIDGNIRLNTQLKPLLIELEKLSKSINLVSYNESGLKIDRYIKLWNKRLLNSPYINLAFNHRFKAMSALDEDYSSTKMLSDGALGFDDYYNNWLISSIGSSLKLEISLDWLTPIKTIQMSFLNDKKHKIYSPEKVLIKIGDKSFTKIINPSLDDHINIIDVEVPINKKMNGEQIYIEIIKQNNYIGRAIACDEIRIY